MFCLRGLSGQIETVRTLLVCPTKDTDISLTKSHKPTFGEPDTVINRSGAFGTKHKLKTTPLSTSKAKMQKDKRLCMEKYL